jgi:xanthine/CO dehydrogenase XdhC/CoxF family maturation factor
LPALALQSWRDVFLELAKALAAWQGHPLVPLRDTKGSGPAPLPELPALAPTILLFGQTRITEEFGRILQFLDWQAQVFRNRPLEDAQAHLMVCELPLHPEAITVPPGAWVVIASHHKEDAAIAEHALRAGAHYVALVASAKRSRLIALDLKERQLPSALLQNFCAPAGLNMPTDTPLQIAFSIVCEILLAQNLATSARAMRGER